MNAMRGRRVPLLSFAFTSSVAWTHYTCLCEILCVSAGENMGANESRSNEFVDVDAIGWGKLGRSILSSYMQR